MSSKTWEAYDAWERMMDVNFFGVLRGVQAFAPRMIEAGRPAVIINTGSKAGHHHAARKPGLQRHQGCREGAQRATCARIARGWRADFGPPLRSRLYLYRDDRGLFCRKNPPQPGPASRPWTISSTACLTVTSTSCARTTTSIRRATSAGPNGPSVTLSKTGRRFPAGMRTSRTLLPNSRNRESRRLVTRQPEC